MNYRKLVLFAILLASIGFSIERPTSSVSSSWDLTSDIGTLVATNKEYFRFDLNEYITGQNLSFSVNEPFTVLPKMQVLQQNTLGQNFTLTGSGPPLDGWRDWVVDSYWVLMDDQRNLWYYKFDPSTNELTFNQVNQFSDDSNVICNNIIRPAFNKILIACDKPSDPHIVLFLIQIDPFQILGTLNRGIINKNSIHYAVDLPLVEDIFILYSPVDRSCKDNGYASVYNFSDPTNINETEQIGGKFWDGSPNICLQSVGVANSSVYLLDYNGGIYRADYILHPNKIVTYSAMISDKPTDMSVKYEQFLGTSRVAIAVASSSAMYFYDWTDPTNAKLIEKYTLTRNNSQTLMIGKSVNFMHLAYKDNNGLCRYSAFYTDSSHAYYDLLCPNGYSGAISVCDPKDIVFFGQGGTSNPSYTVVYMQRSYLTVDTQTVQSLVAKVSVNGDSSNQIKIPVEVIDSFNYTTIVSNNSQSGWFGVSAPGSSEFSMGSLFNGPLMDITFNVSGFQIEPLHHQYSFTSPDIPTNDTLSRCYSFDGSNLKWAFISEDDFMYIVYCTKDGIQFECKEKYKKNLFPQPDPNTSNSSAGALDYRSYVEDNKLYFDSEESSDINNFDRRHYRYDTYDSYFWDGETGETSNSTIEDIEYPFLVANEDYVVLSKTYVDSNYSNGSNNSMPYWWFGGYIQPFQNISIYDQKLELVFEFNMNMTKSDMGQQCKVFELSMMRQNPYLVCISQDYIYFFNMLDPKQANETYIRINPKDYGIDWSQTPQIQFSKAFPSILFMKGPNQIYFWDLFTMQSGFNSPVMWTLEFPQVIQGTPVDFGTAQNYLFLISSNENSIHQFDISSPRYPILIKFFKFSEFRVFSVLSDPQTTNNLILYGVDNSGADNILVFHGDATGNSNLFDKAIIQKETFQTKYQTFTVSDDEYYFFMPYSTTIGFSFKDSIFVSYEPAKGQGEGDYAIDVSGSNPVDQTIRNATIVVEVTETIAKIISHANSFYDPTISFNNASANITNYISFDPRIIFGGTIDSMTLTPEFESDNITFSQQVESTGTYDWADMTDVYDVQKATDPYYYVLEKNRLTVFKNAIKSASAELMPGYPNNYICDHVDYNQNLTESLASCKDTKNGTYWLVKSKISIGAQVVITPQNPVEAMIDSSDKIMIVDQIAFILETNSVSGSLIHIYNYTTLKYYSYVESGDFDTQLLIATDMDVNYLGSSNRYRLFVADKGWGLRVVDCYVQNEVITFQNGALVNLPVPANCEWNGVSISNKQSDYKGVFNIFLTSANFNGYLINYDGRSGAAVVKQKVSAPQGGKILRICDSNDYFVSVIGKNSTGSVALVYLYSNLTTPDTSQSFPIFSKKIVTPTQTSCPFSVQPSQKDSEEGLGVSGNGASGSFYSADKLYAYSLSSNVTMTIPGLTPSEYVSVTAFNSLGNATSRYYLTKPPSGDGSNTFEMLLLIMGCVVALLCVCCCLYCVVTTRKKLDHEKLPTDPSYYRDGDATERE